MTGTQLHALLETMADIDQDVATVALWIDACQKEVSLELPVLSTHTLAVVVSGTLYALTHTILKVTEITASDETYDVASVNVVPGGVTFTEALVDVDIKYESLADTYTAAMVNTELSIHPALHSPMVYYLLFCYYNSEGEGDTGETNLAELYYNKWVYLKDKAIAKISASSSLYSDDDPVSPLDNMPASSRRAVAEENYYE